MIEGIMLHDQLYQIFLFVRLNKYANVQKERHKEETKARRRLNEYFIKHNNRLIKETGINFGNVIPIEWYDKSRFDFSIDDVRKTAIFAFRTWVQWEKDTKILYEKMYYDLITEHFISDAEHVLDLIKDVSKELNEAEEQMLYLDNVGYDPVEIMELNI